MGHLDTRLRKERGGGGVEWLGEEGEGGCEGRKGPVPPLSLATVWRVAAASASLHHSLQVLVEEWYLPTAASHRGDSGVIG